LLAVILIVGCYTWLLPLFFHGAKTAIPLVLGVLVGAIAGGIATKTFAYTAGVRGWASIGFSSLVVAMAVVLSVLGALTKLYGS
jgi:uncharacterized protein (DUF697 family)